MYLYDKNDKNKIEKLIILYDMCIGLHQKLKIIDLFTLLASVIIYEQANKFI